MKCSRPTSARLNTLLRGPEGLGSTALKDSLGDISVQCWGSSSVTQFLVPRLPPWWINNSHLALEVAQR